MGKCTHVLTSSCNCDTNRKATSNGNAQSKSFSFIHSTATSRNTQHSTQTHTQSLTFNVHFCLEMHLSLREFGLHWHYYLRKRRKKRQRIRAANINKNMNWWHTAGTIFNFQYTKCTLSTQSKCFDVWTTSNKKMNICIHLSCGFFFSFSVFFLECAIGHTTHVIYLFISEEKLPLFDEQTSERRVFAYFNFKSLFKSLDFTAHGHACVCAKERTAKIRLIFSKESSEYETIVPFHYIL